MSEYPQRNIGFDKDGWALDLQTNRYLKGNRKDAALYTDKNGWLWGEVVKRAWSWPQTIHRPGYLGDGSYVDLHPSRWDTVWRSDIEALARKMVDKYGCTANTYWWHPPELGLDSVSVDFWGKGGRGDWIPYEMGQAIFEEIFNDPNPPWIRYCIWQGTMYGAWNNWQGEPYGADEFSYHNDHPHFSFW